MKKRVYEPRPALCQNCGVEYMKRNSSGKRCPICSKAHSKVSSRLAGDRYAQNVYKLEGVDELKKHAIRTHRQVG